MTDDPNDVIAEASAQFRVDMATEFGKFRVTLAECDAALLRWYMVFGAAQTAVLAGLLILWR